LLSGTFCVCFNPIHSRPGEVSDEDGLVPAKLVPKVFMPKVLVPKVLVSPVIIYNGHCEERSDAAIFHE